MNEAIWMGGRNNLITSKKKNINRNERIEKSNENLCIMIIRKINKKCIKEEQNKSGMKIWNC